MFALRFSLYAIENLLLTATSLLFARRLLLGSWYSLVGPLLFRCSFHTVHRTFAQSLLHANLAITCWQLTTHRSLFSVFDSLLTNRRALLVVLCVLLNVTHLS